VRLDDERQSVWATPRRAGSGVATVLCSHSPRRGRRIYGVSIWDRAGSRHRGVREAIRGALGKMAARVSGQGSRHSPAGAPYTLGMLAGSKLAPVYCQAVLTMTSVSPVMARRRTGRRRGTRPANRDAAQEAGAIARPGACGVLAPERVAAFAEHVLRALLPRALTTTMIATEMPVTISPCYSMAVAPD
jgi:hypothetical protein